MLRRELLKYFAAGTIITPLGASPVKAELLEVPRVRPIEPPKILRPVNMGQLESATLILRMHDDTERSLALTDLLTRGDLMFTSDRVSVTVRISEETQSSPIAVTRSIAILGRGEFL